MPRGPSWSRGYPVPRMQKLRLPSTEPAQRMRSPCWHVCVGQSLTSCSPFVVNDAAREQAAVRGARADPSSSGPWRGSAGNGRPQASMTARPDRESVDPDPEHPSSRYVIAIPPSIPLAINILAGDKSRRWERSTPLNAPHGRTGKRRIGPNCPESRSVATAEEADAGHLSLTRSYTDPGPHTDPRSLRGSAGSPGARGVATPSAGAADPRGASGVRDGRASIFPAPT